MKVEVDKILDVIDSYIAQFIDESKEEGTGLLHKDIDKELYKESCKFDDCVERRPMIEIDIDNNMRYTQTVKLPIDNVFTEVVDYIVYNTHGSRKLFLLMLIECLVEERGFYKQ